MSLMFCILEVNRGTIQVVKEGMFPQKSLTKTCIIKFYMTPIRPVIIQIN